MKLSTLVLVLILHINLYSQNIVEGFEIEPFLSDWVAPAGITFSENGFMYVWELNGTVWVVEDGVKDEMPIIDISEEVAFYGDLGLNGFALHPDFLSNGYIYLLYAVDHHYLTQFGLPGYDPDQTDVYTAQIGRVTRYTLSTDDYRTVIPDSRAVLLGEEITNGIPIVSPSHGIGSLVFGSDKTLLVSAGEGTTWVNYHTGGEPIPEFAYDDLGLELGIIQPYEDVGSFRSQLLESYGGKILRIDPISGLGIASNPFFNINEPNGVKSKVWAMGLRNPFRITLRPNTGSLNPADANPGSLYIGDVGLNKWEEINISNSPGLNFGWPRFEGQKIQPGFADKPTLNLLSVNPLFNGTTCTMEHYRFRDLIQQPTASHNNFFGNPCDSWVEIENQETFIHERPVLCWMNTANNDNNMVYLPGFDSDGNSLPIPLSESGVEGPEFEGIASLAGDFYLGTSFPEEYFGAYFHCDYSGWVKTFWFNENDELQKVEPFIEDMNNIVHLSFNPFDECLYLVEVFPGTIFRVCYGENLRPIPLPESDVTFGPSPLTVQFDGSESFDPDDDPITFEWNFGDDSSSTEISPSHTFTASDAQPQAFEVTLTVTDTAGNSNTKALIISLNNTPPLVEINSFQDGFLYPLHQTTELPLTAFVQDLEQDDDELYYEWQVFFHHNTHFHPEPIIIEHESSFLIEPINCDNDDTFYYRVHLKVTDAAGLSGEDEKFAYPDCSDTIPTPPLTGYLIFPNPASNYVQIKGEFGENTVNVSLYNVMGQEVKTEKYFMTNETNLPIELSSLISGIYIVEMQFGEIREIFKLMVRTD